MKSFTARTYSLADWLSFVSLTSDSGSFAHHSGVREWYMLFIKRDPIVYSQNKRYPNDWSDFAILQWLCSLILYLGRFYGSVCVCINEQLQKRTGHDFLKWHFSEAIFNLIRMRELKTHKLFGRQHFVHVNVHVQLNDMRRRFQEDDDVDNLISIVDAEPIWNMQICNVHPCLIATNCFSHTHTHID